jgi:hypothetical protein
MPHMVAPFAVLPVQPVVISRWSVLTAVRPRLIKTETALHHDDVHPRLPQAVHRPDVARAADLSTPIAAGQPATWWQP